MDPSSQDGVVLPLSDGRRRLAFALILVVAFGSSLVFSVPPPVLQRIARQFGGGHAGEFTAQFGSTAPSLGWLIGGVLSGWVLARLGRRPVIVAAVIGLGVFGAIAAVLPSPTAFIASRLALGFCVAFAITACVTLLADIYDDQARPKMIGYMKAMASGAALPIGLSSGALAQMVDWRAPFAEYAVFGVIAAIFALFATPAAGTAVRVEATPRTAGGSLIRRLWPLLVLIFFLHIIAMMGVAQMPFALAAKGVTSPVLVSIAISSAGVMMSIGAIVSGHLQSRFGPWPPLCAGVLVAAAGCLTVGAAPNGLITAVGNSLSVLGCGLYFPQYLTLPLSRVAPEERAMAVGVSQSAIYLGAFLNPFLLAPLRELFGVAGTYAAVGTLAAGCTAIGIIYALVRNLGRARARVAPAE